MCPCGASEIEELHVAGLAELIKEIAAKYPSSNIFCNFIRGQYAIQLEDQDLEQVMWFSSIEEAAAKLLLDAHTK